MKRRKGGEESWFQEESRAGRGLKGSMSVKLRIERRKKIAGFLIGTLVLLNLVGLVGRLVEWQR